MNYCGLSKLIMAQVPVRTWKIPEMMPIIEAASAVVKYKRSGMYGTG